MYVVRDIITLNIARAHATRTPLTRAAAEELRRIRESELRGTLELTIVEARDLETGVLGAFFRFWEHGA